MFAVRQNGRPLVSQLDVFRGGPEIGSGNMMNRPRGPPEMIATENVFLIFFLFLIFKCNQNKN